MNAKFFIDLKPHTKRLLLCLLSGALCALAFSVRTLGSLIFLFPIPFLFSVFREQGFRRNLGLCTAFFMSYFILILPWIYELSFIVENSGMSRIASKVLLTFAILLVAAIETGALCLPLAFFPLIRRNSYIDIPIFAALYIIGEFLSAHMGELSFPWGRISTAAAGYPTLISSASLLGSLFVSFIIMVFAGSAAQFLSAVCENGKAGALKRLPLLAAAVAVFALNLGFGFIYTSLPENTEITSGVLMVQGNYGNIVKWRTPISQMVNKYEALTLEGLADHPETEIVLWPETAIPVILNESPDYIERFSELAADNSVYIAVGAFYESGGEIYNGTFFFCPDGSIQGPQLKRLLVPMGEFIPFEGVLEKLVPGLLSGVLNMEQYSHGKDSVIFKTADGNKFGALICYESILPDLARDLSRSGAGSLLMGTNDSWFGQSSALSQHMNHAAMRAVENGKYLLRAANTGITCAITSKGEIYGRIGADCEGTLFANAVINNNSTLYSRCGDIIVPCASIFVFVLAAIKLFSHKKR